jgi:oligo-1,6-glucosidase
MAYAFDAIDIAKLGGYSLLHFKEVFSRWDSAFANKGWLSIFLANHDQARMVSRFGNDSSAFRELSSKMLSTFILTMRGTAFYYNGDELGMTNAGFKKIEEFRDVQTLNEYKHQLNTGADMKKFMARTRFESRDNGRTPFQWSSDANGGFTTGTPWIKLASNYKTINQAAQEKDPNSCLNYFRKLVALRKQYLTLVYGKYTLLDKANPKVYAYTRADKDHRLLILLNFSTDNTQTDTGLNMKNSSLVLCNYKNASERATGSSVITLRPYEARIYQLQ